MRGQFEQAVELAEQAFTEELTRLVAHLSERLSGSVDGRPKVFRDSAVTNLNEFFDRFRRLNIRSSIELDALVERARTAMRTQVAEQLRSVEGALHELMTERPRRRILRGRAAPVGGDHADRD